MQLVAYGAQDVYLTGNPQITFWKVTYRRHTNFAMESIEQTFNGAADFGRLCRRGGWRVPEGHKSDAWFDRGLPEACAIFGQRRLVQTDHRQERRCLPGRC